MPKQLISCQKNITATSNIRLKVNVGTDNTMGWRVCLGNEIYQNNKGGSIRNIWLEELLFVL